MSPSHGVTTLLLAEDGNGKPSQGKENAVRYILKPRCATTLLFAGTVPQAANSGTEVYLGAVATN